MAAPLLHSKPESLSSFHEGISLLLSRWTALQMAVQNKWGGRDSFKKSQQLVSEINSWFSQPKSSLNLEDLENLLHERLLLSFNTEIEDGSIEEVAEQLMTMHEESLHGNLVSFEADQHLLESPHKEISSRSTSHRCANLTTSSVHTRMPKSFTKKIEAQRQQKKVLAGTRIIKLEVAKSSK